MISTVKWICILGLRDPKVSVVAEQGDIGQVVVDCVECPPWSYLGWDETLDFNNGGKNSFGSIYFNFASGIKNIL